MKKKGSAFLGDINYGHLDDKQFVARKTAAFVAMRWFFQETGRLNKPVSTKLQRLQQSQNVD